MHPDANEAYRPAHGLGAAAQRRAVGEEPRRPGCQLVVGQAPGRARFRRVALPRRPRLAGRANAADALDPDLDAEGGRQLLAAPRPRLAVVLRTLAELPQLVVQQLVKHRLVHFLVEAPAVVELAVQVEPD